jgi:hypothetical protein
MKEGVEVCSVPSGDDYILSFHGRNRAHSHGQEPDPQSMLYPQPVDNSSFRGILRCHSSRVSATTNKFAFLLTIYTLEAHNST